MDQQFLLRFNTESGQEYQKLPKIFNDIFYNGQKYIFINGNNRYRYVCLIRVVENEIQLFGSEWSKFVEQNVPSSVKTLHFVKEAEDTFYVTGYNDDGTEGPGYDTRVVGNRVVRCFVRRMREGQILPGEFLQDIREERLKIYANGLKFKVKHERVQLDRNSVVRSNRLFGNTWNKLVAELEIAVGQPMVFTNIGNNKLNLAIFFANGTCLYHEIVQPTMLRILAREIPPYAKEDTKAEHICTWKGHTGHNNEDDVFYVTLNGQVCDFYHVTVPVDYCGPHMMHTYKLAYLAHDDERFPVKVKTIKDSSRPGRINHVKLSGNFRAFAGMCGFKMGKLMRFKLVNTVVEVVEGEELQIPIFHVC